MRKLGECEEAVSPVIGTTLLVGLTMIMISVVALSVFAFSLPQNAPHAKIVVVEAKGGINKYLHENIIVLKHKGGDALFENYTKVIITGKGYTYSTGSDPHLPSQDIRVVYNDLTGENDIYGGDDEEIVEGTSWDAGEQIELYGRDGYTGDNTVDSKWKLKAGSTVLVTIIDTNTNEVIAVSHATVKKV